MTLPYIHLSLADRREIARMHAARIPVRLIAERLQRHRSTIYREIKRNWVHDEEPLSSLGHWEGDLMMFRRDLGKHNLTSLIERQSRYTILTRNRDRNSTGVMTGMIEKLKVLPETARLSITFDRGTEFAYYPLLKQKLGMDSYFCKPQAPWQKGSVENTNGRVRRFLSRDTDIAELADETLREVCERLNGTASQVLGL